MPRRLTHRKPLYQLPPEALATLQQLPRSSSRRTATHVLRLIGQWCVDNATDGRLSERDLRELHDFSAWRVMQRYVSLFVDSGLLIDLGQGEYIVEHFDSYHAPAWLQERRIHERRAKTRIRVRALRERRTSENREKSETCEPCTPIACDPRSVEDPKETNQPATRGEREIARVSSHGDEEADDAFFSRLASMAATAEPEPAAAPAQPQLQPQRAPAREPPGARRPARMPREQRAVNEGDVAAAVKRLRLGPEYVPELHSKLSRIGATDADVGYAVRAIEHATSSVSFPDRYLLGVIQRQQLHRLAAAGLKSVGS